MKVLLTRPPQKYKIGLAPRGPRFSLPIGLLSIGTFLELNNQKVELFDFLTEKRDNILFNYQNTLKNNIGKELLCGASYKSFKVILENFCPHIIGISNPFSENLIESLHLAKYIKSINSNIIVVLGGASATINRHYIIENNQCIDYIISGDGEKPLLNLCTTLEKNDNPYKIDGITFIDENHELIDNKAIFNNKDLDFCDYYNYELLKLNNYHFLNSNLILSRNTNLINSGKSISIISSKGCPYQCSFCSVAQISGNSFRFNSAQFIVNQMEYLLNKYGISHFHFEDDNISYKLKRFEELLDLIIAKKIKITWDTPNGIHHKNLNETILKKMKISGCQYFILGIESRNENVLKYEINKKINFNKVQDIIKYAKKLNLPIHAFFMIGFPNEKKSQILQTVFYAIKQFLVYSLIPHLSILRPDRGTKIYNKAQQLDILVENHKYKNPFGYRATTYTRNIINSHHFTAEYLESIYYIFHLLIVCISFLKSLFYMATRRGCLKDSIRIYKKLKHETKLNSFKIFPLMQWNYFYYLK